MNKKNSKNLALALQKNLKRRKSQAKKRKQTVSCKNRTKHKPLEKNNNRES